MHLRKDKTAYAVGRPSWRSSFLGDAGAKFLCGKLDRGTKKEKSSKKERKEGLWKLTPLMEIRLRRGFPPRLEKASLTTLDFFTVPTGSTTNSIQGKETRDRVQLDDPDHFLENLTASVASLRRLIDISPKC